MRLENNPTSFIISTISISRVIFLLVKTIFLQDKKYSPALNSVICPFLISSDSTLESFFCSRILCLKHIKWSAFYVFIIVQRALILNFSYLYLCTVGNNLINRVRQELEGITKLFIRWNICSDNHCWPKKNNSPLGLFSNFFFYKSKIC